MRFFLLLALVLPFFCACQSPSSTSSSLPKVLVSIAPEKFLVEKIANDTVSIEVLVPPGASPHTYEPSARQVLAVAEASLWFRIGESFEVRAIEALKSHREISVIDLREPVDLLPLSCCHEHTHQDRDAHDSHIWLSPRLLKQEVTLIAETLIKKYPEHKSLYEKNLQAFISELEELDQEISQLLENSPRRVILVSHPAFAYFCRDYHLKQLSIEVEGKDPTAKQLTQLLDTARKEQINYVFLQEQYNTKGAELIAQELQAEVMLLDPYAENIVENLRKIALAFSQ